MVGVEVREAAGGCSGGAQVIRGRFLCRRRWRRRCLSRPGGAPPLKRVSPSRLTSGIGQVGSDDGPLCDRRPRCGQRGNYGTVRFRPRCPVRGQGSPVAGIFADRLASLRPTATPYGSRASVSLAAAVAVDLRSPADFVHSLCGEPDDVEDGGCRLKFAVDGGLRSRGTVRASVIARLGRPVRSAVWARGLSPITSSRT